jgi:hypothetical protein
MFPVRTTLLLIIFLGFLACSSRKEPPAKTEDFSPVLKRIVRTEKGLFRGLNIGMGIAEVRGMENDQKPDDEAENYLSYSFAFNDTLQGNIYYNFEDGLDEIGVDIFREKKKECDWLFSDFKNYFTKRYGAPKEENLLLIWYVKDQGKEGAEITLSDESKDYGYGKLTLTIFPFQSEVNPGDKEVKPELSSSL